MTSCYNNHNYNYNYDREAQKQKPIQKASKEKLNNNIVIKRNQQTKNKNIKKQQSNEKI